jgi:hypothetical protein
MLKTVTALSDILESRSKNRIGSVTDPTLSKVPPPSMSVDSAPETYSPF